MHINSTNADIVTENVGEKTDFKFAQTAQAFRILSDTIYSDKITAIIRELCTNAIDGHKKAGKEAVPFTVKLPNDIDPTFYVKDEGSGLSHDQIMNLYTTYFASDKSDTNNFIGGFGLGSKSPFSYSEMFSVVSVFDGYRRTYNAFINENDFPSIALLHEEMTDEVNGVTVSFPVKYDDFSEFSNKLMNVCLFFDIKPKVIGNRYYKERVPVYYTKHDTWGILKSSTYDSYSAYSQPKIVMGGVAYNLSSSQISSNITCDTGDITLEDRNICKDVLNIDGLVLFMNVGDVGVNPSREAINFKKSDVAAIRAACLKVNADMRKSVNDIISNIKTPHDCFSYLKSSAFSDLRSYMKQLLQDKTKFSFDGSEYTMTSYYQRNISFPHNYSAEYISSGYNNRRKSSNLNYDNAANKFVGNVITFAPASLPFIIIDDGVKKNKTRLALLKKSADAPIYLIKKLDDIECNALLTKLTADFRNEIAEYEKQCNTKNVEFKYPVLETSDLSQEQISKMFMGFPVTLLSSYPLPEKVKAEKVERVHSLPATKIVKDSNNAVYMQRDNISFTSKDYVSVLETKFNNIKNIILVPYTGTYETKSCDCVLPDELKTLPGSYYDSKMQKFTKLVAGLVDNNIIEPVTLVYLSEKNRFLKAFTEASYDKLNVMTIDGFLTMVTAKLEAINDITAKRFIKNASADIKKKSVSSVSDDKQKFDILFRLAERYISLHNDGLIANIPCFDNYADVFSDEKTSTSYFSASASDCDRYNQSVLSFLAIDEIKKHIKNEMLIKMLDLCSNLATDFKNDYPAFSIIFECMKIDTYKHERKIKDCMNEFLYLIANSTVKKAVDIVSK